MDVLYDDGKVVVDQDGVTLRRYYAPTGSAKTIPFEAIRQVEVKAMGWLSGKARLWGSGSLKTWLPLDASRFGKDRVVVLDLGKRVNPAFTPDDPDHVAQIIRAQL